MDWTDARSIDEMSFAMHVADEDDRRARADRVRTILKAAGCKTAADIVNLGCTGLVGAGCSVEDAAFVRAHMSGAGVGLTCFVDLDRFCFVHNTIGGLQEGQAARHQENLGKVSRELTQKEKIGVDLVEHARRMRSRDGIDRIDRAGDMLAGRNDEAIKEALAPKSSEIDLDGTRAAVVVPAPVVVPTAAAPVVQPLPVAGEVVQTWECPEHGETLWQCRFCVAAEIVKGKLVPDFLMTFSEEGTSAPIDNLDEISAGDIADTIKKYDEQDASAVGLYVKVARWVRRLARD